MTPREQLELFLPGPVPADEQILWHGRPDWLALARRAFRVEWVLAYFVVLGVWNFASPASDGQWADAFLGAGRTAAVAVLALALLGFLAWLSARTTLYMITSRRVVMKVGIALPIFFNLPFSSIASAGLQSFGGATGDISLALGPKETISYFHLWPHARPAHIVKPEPALRGLANAPHIAEILSRALIAASRRQHPGDSALIQIVPKRVSSVRTLLPANSGR